MKEDDNRHKKITQISNETVSIKSSTRNKLDDNFSELTDDREERSKRSHKKIIRYLFIIK